MKMQFPYNEANKNTVQHSEDVFQDRGQKLRIKRYLHIVTRSPLIYTPSRQMNFGAIICRFTVENYVFYEYLD